LIIALAGLALADTCPAYEPVQITGEVRIPGISESSGVAASRVRSGVFYTHDDGGQPQIAAFRADGTALEVVEVAGAELEDWEDLAAAPCPDKGDCLYIGDIGDGGGGRSTVTVYVVREPDEGDDKARVRERYTAAWPAGASDLETLMVHPCTGRIHLVSKSDDGLSAVYRFPPLQELGRDAVQLEEVAQVQVDGPTAQARRVTGGDYDLDGDRVVLRTGTQLLEWAIDPAAPNAHWSTPPRVLAAASEQQGEGVAFDLDGGLVTTSEGSPFPVGRLTCEPEPSGHACDFPQSGCGCVTGASPAGYLGWLMVLGAGLAQRRQRSMRDQPS